MKTLTIISGCEGSRNAYGQKDYESLAIRLVKSLRKNGGLYRDCSVVFCYDLDYSPSDITRKFLEDNYKCIFCPVPPAVLGVNPSIKASACAMDFNTDYVLWLDTDIYINSSFEELLDIDVDVVVSPPSNSFNKWARKEEEAKWSLFYKSLGVSFPTENVITLVDKKPCTLYFSSGIILFKNYLGFGQKYLEVIRKLSEVTEVEDRLEGLSQTALTATIVKYSFSYKTLSKKFHYCYVANGFKLDAGEKPSIIHYQDCIVKEIPEWDI